MSRYARQIAVPEFGAAGQRRVAAARVLVVGAGGLAAPLVPLLVGAGVGRIDLVDPDRVARTNLHRQTIFREGDLDRPKAVAVARHMADLNVDAPVTPHVTALDPGNVDRLAHDADLIIDAADSFAVSYILSDHALASGQPLLSAAVTGMGGHAGGFCGGAPSLRAVFPDLPQRLGTCAEDGVLGPAVGILGAVQAHMALTVLADLAPSPLGQLVTLDGLRFGGFRFDGACEPAHRPMFIAASEIDPSDYTIDLRQPDEGPIAVPWARRHTVPEMGAGGPTPAAQQRAVLVCRSGLRAWQAAGLLVSRWPGKIALVALNHTDPDA